jgi:glucose-1-phosphate cytidylyltransferase
VKVVLFCGGLGVRLREYAESVPKPMILIGDRPILWHIMKYYAHFGHDDFVLCLGYRADAVKEYFLNYSEAVSNDFVLSNGGRHVRMLSSDIDDWRITFADTGMSSNIGQRLMAVRKYVAEEDTFLASYGDCLTDAPLGSLIADFNRSNMVASFLGVRPTYPVHLVIQRRNGVVSQFQNVSTSGLRINGGYFIFRQSIFDYMCEGDELVVQPFQRLIERGLLKTYPHDGFWAPMDTLWERQDLEALAESGRPPWAVWQRDEARLLVGARVG